MYKLSFKKQKIVDLKVYRRYGPIESTKMSSVKVFKH